ncbi:MAG: carbohydrate ABC transporter permease [Acetivibrionales bacterium]
MAIITLGPFIYDVYLSLTDRYLASSDPVQFVGLMNYVNILKDKGFWNAVLVTAIYIFLAVSIELVLGFIMALLFQIEFRGKKIVRSAILLPMVATPIAIAFMWRIMYNPNIGIINYLLSLVNITGIEWVSSQNTALISVILVDIWQWTPFMFLILSSGISALPKDPFEAAIVDGASSIQILKHVMLPLLKPIITIGLVFRLVDSFKSFDTIYVLTGGGPGTATETLNIQVYLNAFKYLKMGHACALSIIMIIIIIFVCNFVVKRGQLNFE